jgi:uncharacterized membrane protein YbhN (UPF0104 family)
MGFLRRHAAKLVASVLITAGVLYVVHSGGLKLIPDRGDFGAVRWWMALAIYPPLMLASTWFRSVRWRFLLRQIIEVPKLRLLAVSCAGYLAILLLPFRLGELARPYMLRTRPEELQAAGVAHGVGDAHGVGVTHGVASPGPPILTMAAATASVVAERVIDGLFLSIVLAIALVAVPTLEPLPDKVVGLPITVAHVRMLGFAMLGLFTIAFATIAVFYVARGWAVRTTERVIGLISPRLAAALAGFAARLADGLHVFSRGRDFAGFVFETALYWLLNALATWALAIACGVVHANGSAITFGEALTLMGMLGCTVLIPGPPGLLGVFQAGLYAAMTMYFPTAIVTGPGSAFVFLMYAIQVALAILVGLWGLWHERRRL